MRIEDVADLVFGGIIVVMLCALVSDLPAVLDALELAVKHLQSSDPPTPGTTLWKLCNAMTKGTE